MPQRVYVQSQLMRQAGSGTSDTAFRVFLGR